MFKIWCGSKNYGLYRNKDSKNGSSLLYNRWGHW